MNLTLQLKEVAQWWEMDYIGVAPIDRLANAPPG